MSECLEGSHDHVDVCNRAGRRLALAEVAERLEEVLAEPYDRLEVEWPDGEVEQVDVVTVASVRRVLEAKR